MTASLVGKRAFVTGASRGIGAAIAGVLEGAGAEVFAGYREHSGVPHGRPFRCDHAAPSLPPASRSSDANGRTSPGCRRTNLVYARTVSTRNALPDSTVLGGEPPRRTLRSRLRRLTRIWSVPPAPRLRRAGGGSETRRSMRSMLLRLTRIPSHFPPAPLHILVNNAGIWVPTPVDSDWRRNWDVTLHVNLRAVAELCRMFAEQAPRGACIVNVTSRAAHRGEAGYAAYAASKAGVNALTKSLATELGPRGIRVNAVAPGWVRTDMTRAALPAEGLPEPIPLGRIGEPGDVAGPVLFLCSDLAQYVTGVVLDVCGGAYLH